MMDNAICNVQKHTMPVLVLAALFSKLHILDAAIGDYTLDGQLAIHEAIFLANLTAIS